ncbi:hypothetical protein Bca52824_018739 [Brassica carinata]|uniref:Uncharacterized protein n=1 Tax=Brassica carinata TaxID=52824 RepID=A0A8X7VR23_BRACI|nr:hypothetical protein Bca52824_018739 [Brassica carinata]
MATVCVKNVGTSPEKISTASYSCRSSKMSAMSQEPQPLDPPCLKNEEDPVDFEFLLEDPVTMLTADELFSDGKLVPLKFSGAVTSSREKKPITTSVINTAAKPCRRMEVEIDPYTFSPRAPRCTVRWRELLGLKRPTKTPEEASLPSRLSTSTPNPKTASFSRFLNRSSKSSKDSDISETSTSTSISSSHSLDHDNKPNNAPNPFARSRPHHHHQLRKPRRHSPSDKTTERALTVTADSPRLNASGKIVFHGLERSSSSPGNFTGGPRMKHHHGMPRSQSANVRITPVLNVPVSSLRGASKPGLSFGQLFASSSGNNITKNQD